MVLSLGVEVDRETHKLVKDANAGARWQILLLLLLLTQHGDDCVSSFTPIRVNMDGLEVKVCAGGAKLIAKRTATDRNIILAVLLRILIL